MDSRLAETARTCLSAAERNEMTFPQIVGTLMQAGFESYAVDFRRACAVYFLPNGDSVELPAHRAEAAIPAALDASAIHAAIREAQLLVPGYTYLGFCEKARAAGCAGYTVSFVGRRAVYFGRDGATHVEHFPQ